MDSNSITRINKIMGNGPNSISHEKSSEKWIRVPLLIKKVMDNRSELHYSKKK